MADFTTNPNLDKPIYSVIVLIYHRSQELVDMALKCIDSVKANSSDYELIVVDNGSTFRHPWEIECDTYIRFAQNWGISRGWNAGLKAARGEYLVIIGDDTEVVPGWLEAMKIGLDQPQAGMCNPHLEHLPGGSGIVENYKWPSGACFMLSRKVVDKVGYFAEETYFPANYEDLDYWTRLYQSGFKIYRNYAVSVKHKEGQTVHSPDIEARNEANKQRFIAKHGFDPIPVFFGAEKRW